MNKKGGWSDWLLRVYVLEMLRSKGEVVQLPERLRLLRNFMCMNPIYFPNTFILLEKARLVWPHRQMTTVDWTWNSNWILGHFSPQHPQMKSWNYYQEMIIKALLWDMPWGNSHHVLMVPQNHPMVKWNPCRVQETETSIFQSQLFTSQSFGSFLPWTFHPLSYWVIGKY